MPEGPIQPAAATPAPIAAGSVKSPSGAGSGGAHPKPHSESAQEMVMSIIIAFALAFVFRGFVVEAAFYAPGPARRGDL
mgnify:CR=1 FL=1